MNVIANILLALIIFSGVYVHLSQSWNGLYRANIFFHPVFGTLATLVLIAHYILHARARAGKGPVNSGAGITVFIVLSAAFGYLSAIKPMLFMPLACIAAAAGLFFTTRKVLAANMPRHIRPAAVGWQIVFFLLIVCMFNGLALLPMDGFARPKSLFVFHRYVSYATVAAFVICLIIPVISRRAAGIEWKSVAAYLRTTIVAVSVMLAFGAATALIMYIEKAAANDPVYNASLSTIPLEKRAPVDGFQKPLAHDVAGMMQMSESCATNSGCHQQEMQDFVRSNHNVSMRTPYFQKNLDMMVKEIGPKNLLICSGCHYPYMMFSGNYDYKYYMTHNGLSCVYCHQIGSVRRHPNPKEKRITYITVEPNVAHLRMFYNANGNPRISKWDELLVKMNPAGHGRVFTKPLYYQDEYCQVCHALQIKTPGFTGLQQNSCIRCHMQPRYYLGLEGRKMNHYFPGTNAAIPYLLGDYKTAKMVSDWVIGKISMDVPAVTFWKLREKSDERSSVAVWLFMNLEPLTDARPGGEYDFNIITTNTGIDHQFPSAPLDLVEAWLQVTVTDARGRKIYDLGALDKTYRLPDDYPQIHRLGGYMINSQDHLVVKNRVWDIKKKFVLRNIMPGATDKDKIGIQIPADAVGPLTMTAKWNYRKLNQDFIDWGLEGVDMHGKPKTAPVTVVGSLTAQIQLQQPAPPEKTKSISRKSNTKH